MSTKHLERDVFTEAEPFSASANERSILEEIDALLRQTDDDDADRARPMLLGPNNERIGLPEPVFRILQQIVPHLLKGHALTIVPVHQQLSTQEAADILNVSRPFLIGLLERGEIPYVKTGKHRRIRFGHLMAYKKQRDMECRKALERLVELGQEYGLDAYGD